MEQETTATEPADQKMDTLTNERSRMPSASNSSADLLADGSRLPTPSRPIGVYICTKVATWETKATIGHPKIVHTDSKECS
jgi:hypothetical protein